MNTNYPLGVFPLFWRTDSPCIRHFLRNQGHKFAPNNRECDSI